MVEAAAIVERVSKALGVPPDELVRKGIECFLGTQLRLCSAEIRELMLRYNVNSAGELKEKISSGVIGEHPSLEDLMVFENLEERANIIRNELKAFKS
jgi:hypothetical protein